MRPERQMKRRPSRRNRDVLRLSVPEPGHPDLSLLSRSQQQIAELEGSVTLLRQRVMDLNASQSELIQARVLLGDLFQNAPVGYVVHDHAGAISEINHTARAMLGLELGQGAASIAQFLPTDQVALWLEHMRRADTSLRADTDVTLRSQRGRPILVQLVTLALPVSKSAKIFRTILIDTSQRRAAEAALAQTQRDYHRLIDTVEGIVWEADARCLRVSFVSGYAERLLGYPMSEWRRPDFWHNRIYVEDRERVANAIAGAVRDRQALRIDYRVVAADRRIVWLHDNITTLEREGRLRLLGVAVDVTEHHRTQDDLRRTQELLEQRVAERTAELRANVQELEAFSYSISHDLRAPLRAIMGFAEIAFQASNDQLSSEVKDCLRRIMDAGVRADRLVQDVLAYSRVSRANFQLARLNLDTFVPNLIAQYPDFQPPKAHVRLEGPLLPVLAHEALLGQCITNLLGNAVKFVAAGAAAEITVRTEPASEAQAVRLWFEDNGLGIEPQDLVRIFNIFERVHPGREYPGTGIGLAIVRKAVERMGGAVGVESEPGKGSKFWVQLKAA